MAPRRSAKRFLAGPLAATRIGLVPVLVAVVVFAAHGCGGGGSSSTAEGTTSGSATDASGSRDGESTTEKAPASSEGVSGGHSRATDPEGRHRPSVAMPTGEREPAPTAKQKAETTVADIALQSPSLSGAAVPRLPMEYTCDGEDVWPALEWTGVPPGTAELALLLVNTQPVNEHLFFGWAVAGLSPELTGIESGKLPRGTILGRNGFGETGYSVCPPKQSSETYFFTLYALPRHLGVKAGFNPLELRETSLELSHNAGLLPVSYARG